MSSKIDTKDFKEILGVFAKTAAGFRIDNRIRDLIDTGEVYWRRLKSEDEQAR